MRQATSTPGLNLSPSPVRWLIMTVIKQPMWPLFICPRDQFFTDYAGNMGQYGWGGADSYPLVWDYNGDGTTEVSIYHIPTNQWFVKGCPEITWASSDGAETSPFLSLGITTATGSWNELSTIGLPTVGSSSGPIIRDFLRLWLEWSRVYPGSRGL